MNRSKLAALVMSSTVALTACSGSTTDAGSSTDVGVSEPSASSRAPAASDAAPPPGAPSADDRPTVAGACELLDPAEVGAAFAYTVTEVPPVLEGDTGCEWVDGDGERVIGAGYLPDYGSENFPAYRDMQEDARDVSAIGDAAFWAGDQLHILVGEAYLTLNPSGGRLRAEREEAAIESGTEDLGRLAAERLR